MRQSNYSDLVDVLAQSVERYPTSHLFGTKVGDEWQWITYAQFGRRVDDFRGALPGNLPADLTANRTAGTGDHDDVVIAALLFEVNQRLRPGSTGLVDRH